MTSKSDVARRHESVLSENEIEKIKDRIGPVIHRMRKCAGVSQTELADILSLHQTAVCRIEQGSPQRLSVMELYVLSQFFGVKMENLIQGDVNYWGYCL